MKAKEYAQEYIQAKSEGKSEIEAEILTEFYKETNELIEKRKAKSDSAIFAIFDEMHNKWVSFINKINMPSHLEVYKLMLNSVFGKEVTDSWSAYNKLIAGATRKTDKKTKTEIINEIEYRGKLRKALKSHSEEK